MTNQTEFWVFANTHPQHTSPSGITPRELFCRRIFFVTVQLSSGNVCPSGKTCICTSKGTAHVAMCCKGCRILALQISPLIIMKYGKTPILDILRHLKDSQLNSYLNSKKPRLQVIFRAEYHQSNNFFSNTMFSVICNVNLWRLKRKPITPQLITIYKSRPFDLSTFIAPRGVLFFMKVYLFWPSLF